MPNGDDKIGTIVADPDFQGLGLADQQQFLSKVDPDFGKLDTGSFSTFLARYKGQSQGTPITDTSTISARPSLGSRAWSAFKEGGMTGLGQELGESTKNALANVPIPGVGKTVGQGLEDVGKMANMAGTTAGALFGGPEAAGMLPNTARAGAKFADVASTVGSHTIDAGKVGDVALRTKQLAESGGRMPKVVNDFLRRATDPEKGPITYNEARDFYSNATKLASEEYQKLTPIMQRQVAQFTKELGSSLEETAARGGKDAVLKSAMKEYANAQKMKSAGKTIVKAATIGAGIGSGYSLIQDLLKAVR